MTPPRQDTEELSRERQHFRNKISTALVEEDDPLAVYDGFVRWTLENYEENDPHSGLLELLEETTRTFKDDTAYRGDLRYLKLWCLYARRVEKPATVYAFLIANNIGTKYSALYEEYANALEQDGL
jgi:checkpoint serine/threonine-protein kinase